MKKDLTDKTKKNLLDMNYQKYLQYYNTTIIITFTYIIGVAIAFIAKQVDFKNTRIMILIAILSVSFLSTSTLLLLNFKKHQNNIKEEVRKLRI